MHAIYRFSMRRRRCTWPKFFLTTSYIYQRFCVPKFFELWGEVDLTSSERFPMRLGGRVKLTPPPKPQRGEREFWKTKSFIYISGFQKNRPIASCSTHRKTVYSMSNSKNLEIFRKFFSDSFDKNF